MSGIVAEAVAFASGPAPGGLIRLSVGIEPAADVIADIGQALKTLEVP